MGMPPEGRELRLMAETLARIDRKLDELKGVAAVAQQATTTQSVRPAEGDNVSREVERVVAKLEAIETVLGRLDTHEKEAAAVVTAAASAIRREVNVYLMVIAGLAVVAVILAVIGAAR